MQNIIFTFFKSGLYPPTEDQLLIIDLFFGNILFLRIFSLIVLLTTLFFWYKTVFKITSNKVISLLSCLIVFLTPVFYVLWLSFPFDCLKLLIVVFLIYFFVEKKRALFFFNILFIILFSFFTTKERSSFVHKIGLSDAKIEITERFAAEDSLIDPIILPLKIKRIVYNKYFFEYKELINEVIPFFDIESMFFQEIHPTEQKSVVIFVWPEIFLLVGGVYFLLKINNKRINSLILITLLLSLIFYLLNPFIVFRKFELILFPLSLIMALAVENICKTKIFFGRFFGFVIFLFSLYGVLANHIDLNKRPDFWLDNRPYFFEFVFNSIKNKDINNFQKIYVTSLVGNTEEYCKYYLGSCDSVKFVFDSFDLEKTKPELNAIYAGFAGEFIGSDFKNNINKDWLSLVNNKGFINIETKNIRDTIAYKFGNDVVIGEFK